MHKHFFLYFLLSSLVFAYCTPAKKELKKEKYKTVTTFWQIDSFPRSVYSIEQFNKEGKLISKKRFQLNFTFVPIFLESPFKALHEIAYRQMENRSIFKEIISGHFNHDKKDSLGEIAKIEEENQEVTTSDSVVYGVNKKTSYQLIEGEILEKNVTIYFNNKIIKEILYSGEPTKDETTLQILKRTKYFYQGDRLIKKVVSNVSSSEWCPIESNGRTETFTYFYN